MNKTTGPYEVARINMVESQIRPNRIYNVGLLTAMLNIPREEFVPDPVRGAAYLDEKLKLAAGRYLLEPLTTARLFEAAALESDHSVLMVGAGSGYGSAIAGRNAGKVVALEEHTELRAKATRLLSTLGLKNVKIAEHLNRDGYAPNAPYDVIIVEGAMSDIPTKLMAQLTEKGRLIGVLAPAGKVPAVVIAENIHGRISVRIVFDATAPYLPGFEPVPAFQFAS